MELLFHVPEASRLKTEYPRRRPRRRRDSAKTDYPRRRPRRRGATRGASARRRYVTAAGSSEFASSFSRMYSAPGGGTAGGTKDDATRTTGPSVKFAAVSSKRVSWNRTASRRQSGSTASPSSATAVPFCVIFGSMPPVATTSTCRARAGLDRLRSASRPRRRRVSSARKNHVSAAASPRLVVEGYPRGAGTASGPGTDAATSARTSVGGASIACEM